MKKMIIALLLVIVIVAVAAVAYHAVSGVRTAETQEQAVQQTDNIAEDGPTAVLQVEEGADSAETAVELTGTIVEVTEEYVLLDAGEQGQVQANLTDDTMLDGVETLSVGQVAIVRFDGKMTRSLPAQITALHIGVYEVKGTVTAVEEGRVTVDRGESGEVVLTLPQDAPQLAVGDVITAYTTAVSTLSMPPQMNAIAIVK